MKLIVIEDDNNFRNDLVNKIGEMEGMEVCHSASDGEHIIQVVREATPDCVLLDIGLPGKSGIELAKELRKRFSYLDIIFITSFEHHVDDAIELYASDYIRKPLETERLMKTLNRINSKAKISEKILEVKVGQRIEYLKQNDIYVIEAHGRKTLLYTPDKTYLSDYSLKEIKSNSDLDKNMFYLSNRSYIVNISRVTSINPYTRNSYKIDMQGEGISAYLAKKKYNEFKNKIRNFYE